MQSNLENIIEGCKAGKNSSKELLYKLYSGKMWSICLRYAKDYDEAKDVLQDGFMKIFEKIHQYEGRGHFEGWMRRVIVNTALAEYRKQRHLTLESTYPLASDETTFEHIESDMNTEELMKLIKDLPPQYKLVFNLYAIEGYAHKEIAEMLNITEGTSKSNLSRARDILQKKLELINNAGIKIG